MDLFWYQIFTAVLAVLLLSWPFYLVYKGETFFTGVLWTWLMTVIHGIICTVTISSLKIKGYEVEDPLNPIVLAITSGWFPGIFVSGLAEFLRRRRKGKQVESDNDQESG